MNILVIGAGAWGTAMAISAAQPAEVGGGHGVFLWARDTLQAAAMMQTRVNARYLPDAFFPDALQVVSGNDAELLAHAAQSDLVVLATPMAGLRGLLGLLKDCPKPVVWLCKGFEAAQSESTLGLMGHEVAQAVSPNLACGMLSGPSFAQEVARALPAALVVASQHAHVREAAVNAFHRSMLRVYANDDLTGVAVGGAVKNVLAIACGFCDGMQLGLNARAALITRGLAEMSRLGVSLGARQETFMGLSGLGDLVLTATGDLSRNRRVGLMLAQGLSQTQAVASLGHVAEGVYTARTVLARAQQIRVDMPITQGVVALLDGAIQPAQLVSALMEREPKLES